MNNKRTEEIITEGRIAARERTTTRMPEAHDRLAEVAGRIAADVDLGQDVDHSALEGMRQRLVTMKQEAASSSGEPAHDRIAGHADDGERTLERLTQQIGDHDDLDEAEPAIAPPLAADDDPWTQDTAEQLTALCEEAGLPTSEPPLSDADRPTGGPVAQAVTSGPSYIYQQPQAEIDSRQWFEDRFAEMSKRFDAALDQPAADRPIDLLPILAKFESLEARVDAVLGQAPADSETLSDSNLHDIELCIAEIATQLEATTSQLTRMESIEGQITDIAKELAAQRQLAAEARASDPTASLDMTALADLIADKVSSHPATRTALERSESAVGATGNNTEISDLSAVIKDFIRERRSEGEHANAVLDTMQQTIIRVLDRMEALEAGAARIGTAPPHIAQPAPAIDEQAGATQAAAPGAADSDETAAAEQAASRLHQVVGDLEDEEPDAEPVPTPAATPVTQPHPAAAEPPQAHDPNGFAEAARQVAGTKSSDIEDARPSGKSLDLDRARFAAAARQAAANASRRSTNDDTDDDEIDATDDGFSLDGHVGHVQAAGESRNRTRLLVAAVAVVAIGLAASKFMISTSSDTARKELQSNRLQQSSSMTADKKVPAPSRQAPSQKNTQAAKAASLAHKALGDAASATIKPQAAVVKPIATADATVQPAAITSKGNPSPAQSPVSGAPGSVSLKKLPSALVGPLSLRLAAANGNASAEFQVARRYADGMGVKQDFKEALKWYQRSAARGFALSQYRLGTLYERGFGVEKDIRRARAWYERAASLDNIKAMHNLAVLATGSTSGKPDYVTASRWFTQAAERGLGDSQFNLAILYQHGLGVPQDNMLAYKWFSLAALRGDAEATRRKAELGKKIGKANVAKMDRELRGWLRRPSNKLANDPHVAGQAWQRQQS